MHTIYINKKVKILGALNHNISIFAAENVSGDCIDAVMGLYYSKGSHNSICFVESTCDIYGVEEVFYESVL